MTKIKTRIKHKKSNKTAKQKQSFTEVKKCRICGNSSIKTFLSLGPLPTPNGYLTQKTLKIKEPKYPLDVGRCTRCGLVQLTKIVNPNIMFRNYKYVPSASWPMINHFDELAVLLIKNNRLNKNSLAVDIGSNDGTLLKSFKKRGIKIIGIDPAENLAKIANRDGIKTIADFFSSELATKVKEKHGSADVITATNVVAHIADLYDLLKGVEILLSDDGTFVAEFPYLVDLIDSVEFDTIYQEHLSYFSVKPLIYLIDKFNLNLSDIQKIDVHGGSLRVFIKRGKRKKLAPSVTSLLALEDSKKIYSNATYKNFVNKIEQKKKQLMSLLRKLKNKDFRIIGLGASARGNILMNYFGIDTNILDYIVDSTPYKQGLYTPGHHIPIYPESKILEDQPDFILLLAWNFKDAILKKQEEYRKRGGKFILIVPEVEIV